jgi:hypothetical protein
MCVDLLQLTPVGLLLDVAGALFLGFSFFFKSIDSMIEESGTTWDSKAYVAVAETRCDGIFETVLLLLGFIFQALGYLGVHARMLAAATYVGLALVVVAYRSLRRRVVSRWASSIEARFQERKNAT